MIPPLGYIKKTARGLYSWLVFSEEVYKQFNKPRRKRVLCQAVLMNCRVMVMG